ncbi:MAG TPA: hypothetical protein PKC19_02915 [Roseiflexaceae bacterium]|nr:hypothetical protein [Roseiflexaceae bacterium]
MKFDTPTQQQAYTQVNAWMTEIAGNADTGMAFEADEEAPIFGVSYGSAYVEVEVAPFSWEGDDGSEEQDALLIISASVVAGAEMNAESMRYLLEKNEDLAIGAFSLGEGDEIILSTTIPFSYCEDSEELETYLIMICDTADSLDDEIIVRWGGHRASDV